MPYEIGTETPIGRILDFQRKTSKRHRIQILFDCCGSAHWISLRLYHYKLANTGKCPTCAGIEATAARRAQGFRPKSKTPWQPSPADLKGILSASDAWPVPPSVRNIPFIWSPK